MEEVNLMVMIEVLPGKRKTQIDAYNKLKPLVLAESGCIQYDLFCDSENENRFILIEKWESQSDLDMHDQSVHMLEADALNPTFRAKPALVIKMNAISG